MLHGGGGVPARRYRRFAAFLSRSGIPVLTYDYRGIGLSRPATLRGFAAGIEDWIEYDSAAAIAWLRERFPDREIVGISHSIGALMLSGAPNAGAQGQVVLISPHTAYVGDYAWRYRLPMALAWHGVMPLLTGLFGYFPGSRLRLGADLPARFAMQWAGRLSPGFRIPRTASEAARMRRLLGNCAQLERPALVVAIDDDAFATPAGIRRLRSQLPRLSARYLAFTPAEAGTRRLGHFGFFGERAGAALWPRLLANLGPGVMPPP